MASNVSPGLPPPTRPRATSLPLSQLLDQGARAVAAVQAGHSLNEVLAKCPDAARPGTQALVFSAMRRLGTARALKSLLVPKRPAPWVDGLLLLTLALACGEEYTAHTLVDQAVESAKKRARPASGMVNAVLRRFLREREELMPQALRQPEARWNHPTWWIDRLKTDWPGQWEAILASGQAPGPMMLRVNRRRTGRDAYLERLRACGPQGMAAQPWGPDGIVLEEACGVHLLPGFAEGEVSVQDISAQQAAHWLLGAGLPEGARVLDACSAPGGKTAHLLEAAHLDLWALDVDEARLTRVHETLKRLGLRATVKAFDAGRPDLWWDGKPFDAILLDAPCSASGIVRRHPDARWLRRPTDITALAHTQDRLLDALWPLLAPGGRMLFATCSVFKQEGAERVDAFLQRHPEAIVQPAPGHLLPVVEYPHTENLPGVTGDGFFYSLLSKP